MEFKYKKIYIKIDPATILAVISVIKIFAGYSHEINSAPFM